eukprot:TRINITY_DN20823_c0_g1_i1.p1 TRINITY_DN20823_c0_g1~~TRINITY_DN20823_c0_g1_i1.p1  ORF type:complete len:1112 (+),score=385.09 TRINITY_DN20823_c0_g1_i1:71-3406(+)
MSNVEQFACLLQTLLSADNNARNAAEKAFKDAQTKDPNALFLSSLSVLDAAAFPDETLRVQAATLMRRSVLSVGDDVSAWKRLSSEVQSKVKEALFCSLETDPSSKVRKMIVANICTVADVATTPWQELVPNAFKLASSGQESHQEAALRLLSELLNTEAGTAVIAQKEALATLVLKGLGAATLQAASLELVCQLVACLEEPDQKQLQAALPSIENAVQQLAARDPSAFEEALQTLIALVGEHTTFFKPRLAEWLEMMLKMATAKDILEAGQRQLALEWIGTATENKPKMVLKVCPQLPALGLELCFSFMAEVEEDDGWADVDEDAEGDEEDQPLHKMGEAKLDMFVDKLGYDVTKAALSANISKFGASASWEGRFAAATAIRASVEYVEGDMEALEAMAKFLLGLLKDPHMRVRYAALLALGQMSHDQQPEFHERVHAQFVPALIVACNDPVDRVVSMAVGALDALVGDLDEEVLEIHTKAILEMVVRLLQSKSHVGVLESAMELIGSVAAGMEGEFEDYYNVLMPMLQTFVSKAEGGSSSSGSVSKLRGKVFEAISLLGYAVGRQRFAADFPKIMSTMLATPLAADDVQKEYIKDSMERLVKIMGSDFAPFLQGLLPGIYSSINPESVVVAGEAKAGEAKEDEVAVETSKGIMRVKTTELEEMVGVIKLLSTIIKETGRAFYDCIQPTAEVLARVIQSEDISMLATELREVVYPCWAELVNVARESMPTKGDAARELAVKLVQIFVDRVGADISKSSEAADIGSMADGLACVVRNAGAGCLQAAQVKVIAEMCIAEIQKSFQREAAHSGQVLGKGGAKDEDDDDVEAEDDDEDEEAECRIGLAAALGSCMCADAEAFMAHAWPLVLPLLQEWLKPQDGVRRVLGLHLAVDLCEHLKENCVSLWPVFMEAVLEAVMSKDADQRNAAAYALNLAAQVPAFGPQYAGRAYVALATSLQKSKVKKSDEDAVRAQDNTVCALASLCLEHPQQSPDLDGCWSAILGKLPCKVDVSEGIKTHRRMFRETAKPGGGNLQTPARVMKVLGHIVEIYSRSEHCDEELRAEVAKGFAQLPEATLVQIQGQLSEKQAKTVQKILKDGRALMAGGNGGYPAA